MGARRHLSLCDTETGPGDDAISLQLYHQVALRRDLPERGLRRGDVATLVEFVPHPQGGEPGCVLEVFNALGDSLSVVAVAQSDVEELRADEVLAVRALARAV